MAKDPERYSDKEAKACCEAALRGGLSTPPKPQNDDSKASEGATDGNEKARQVIRAFSLSGEFRLANAAPKQVGTSAAGILQWRERRLFVALDPTQRTLLKVPDNGLKLVKAGNGPLCESKLTTQCRLAGLKVRNFFHKSLSAMLFGLCRFLCDPKQPCIKRHYPLPKTGSIDARS